MRFHRSGLLVLTMVALSSATFVVAAAPYRALNTLPSKEARTIRATKKSIVSGDASMDADLLKRWYLYGRLAYFTKPP